MTNGEKRKVDRRYSSVARSIWNHPKFRSLPAPKPNPQTLLFRLLIAPESTSIPGLFQAFRGGLCDALGWKPSAFEKCFAQLQRDGWVEADWNTGLVWVPGAIEQDGNQPANPNVVRGWRGPIAELPDCDLKRKALEKLTIWIRSKGEKWATALDEALGKIDPMASPNPSGKSLPKALVQPSPIQEQEQEQEQEEEEDGSTSALPKIEGGFGADLQIPCPSPVVPIEVVEELAGHYQIHVISVVEVEKRFKNHWIAGKGAGQRFTRGVWMSKFRGWLRRDVEEGKIPRELPGQKTPVLSP